MCINVPHGKCSDVSQMQEYLCQISDRLYDLGTSSRQAESSRTICRYAQIGPVQCSDSNMALFRISEILMEIINMFNDYLSVLIFLYFISGI